MKKIFLLFAFLSPLMASAYDVQIDSIYYNLNVETQQAEVTYSDSDAYVGIVEIPETVVHDDVTYSVKSIGERAFSACKGMTSVTIPSSITSIGDDAFSGCDSLTKVEINSNFILQGYSSTFSLKDVFGNQVTEYILGENVTSIGSSALEGCSGLTSIEIPNSVEGINSSAFKGCSGLTSIQIPNSVTSFGGSVFEDCINLSTVEILSKITNIYSSFFRNCKSLTSVTIPNSVVEIHEFVFDGCSSLTSVTIPNKVKKIGSSAFQGCSSLASIEIPNSVESIGFSAFQGCSSLASIEIPNSITNIYSFTFSDCSSLTSVTIPNSVTEIGDRAFKGCSSLSSVIIGSGVTSVEDGPACSSFLNCNALTKVEINSNSLVSANYSSNSSFKDIFGSQVKEYVLGEEITSIGNSAFASCSGLTSVTIPNSITSIGSSAFQNCFSLTEVHITNLDAWCKINFINSTSNPLYYGGHIYMDGNKITNLVIPESVTSIGNYVFCGYSGLTSVIIPNSVDSICKYAFQKCSGLTSVDIPNSVNSIGEYAFYNCSSLTSIDIPNSVIEIGSNAFLGCSKLTGVHITDMEAWCKINFINSTSNPLCYGGHIYMDDNKITNLVIPESVTSIGNYVFCGYSGLTSVIIPNSVNSIGGSAFYNCSGLTSINIPDSVTEIGSSAFAGCSGITSVTIPNSVTSVGRYAFNQCNDLKFVHISDLTAWCNIAFGNQSANPLGNGEAILTLNGSPLQDQVNIPDGTKKIGAYAFYGMKGVSNFVVPSTVQSIEPYAFNSEYTAEVAIKATEVVSLADVSAFSAKTTIYVNDDLITSYREADVWKNIKDQIYVAGFQNLTVDLDAQPSSPALLTALNALQEINEEYKISNLIKLKIRGTINGWDILMIRNKMPNLRNLDLSEATILDNDGGMEYYQGYHTIAGTISPYTFYNLKNIVNVMLPENVTYIDYNAFASSGIQKITIPSTVTEIGSNAFYGCSNLAYLELNEGLETIGNYAFYNCGGLSDLILPKTLKMIKGSAFQNCGQLTEIDFAEGLEEIESSAFRGCSRLNNLHMPTSLQKIGSYAFQGCSSLTEVHVPSMITEIGDYAFKNCGLKSVYAYTVVPVQINQNTFDYDNVDLYAPANSFLAYYLNTQWSQFLEVKEFDALYTNWYMPRNADLEIDTDKPIQSEDEGNPADGEMEAGSGLIITGDGEQVVNELVIDCEDGENYPSVIENNNLDVEKLTFKMNVRPGRWYFFSFPFDINLTDIKYPKGKWVWRYYDSETRAAQGVGGWKNTVGDVLKANQGYIFQCNTAGVLEIPVDNPEFAESTEKEIPLQSIEAKNPQDASWNFIGNPNLSYYGLNDMAESFDAPITVWNDEQQTYTALIPGDDEYHFHPFEAYFVQTPENVDNMTFENENRVTYSQAKKKENGARSATRSGTSINEKRMLVNLTVSDGQTTDKTRIIFNDDNKLTYETGRDANKFMSMANVPQIYTIDAQNVKYSVNARPNDNRQVRLGFVASSAGEYIIAAERMDCRMALKDNMTGTIHQLDGEAYTFYSEAGAHESRFTLISGSDITSISSNGLEGIEGVNIAVMDGGIVVSGINEGCLNVYKANGVKVASLEGSGTIRLANGTYVVSYAGKSTKIVVK